ncbi:hypothetical protein ACFL01_02860 [Planctomycetota bacterium]
MDYVPIIIYCLFRLGLYAATFVILLRCYRWSGNKGFLWLGVAVAVWPIVDIVLQNVLTHYQQVVINGERPGLFPYSIMATGSVTLGTFRMYHDLIKDVVGSSLVFLSVIMVWKGRAPSAKGPSGDEMLTKGST